MSGLTRPLDGYRSVEVLVGDTLQRIAARTLNDATRWAEVAEINNLLPPYLTGDPSQASSRVILYGSRIFVPAPTPEVAADVDPELVFGVDLDLTGGELHADPVTVDFLLISGRPNLIQALRNRLATPLRDLLFHLGYGLGSFFTIGAKGGPTNSALNARYVRDALQDEKRIASVGRVTATARGDGVSVEGEVVPVQGATINLDSLTG